VNALTFASERQHGTLTYRIQRPHGTLMTSCHCPISVICLVCKGEDLTPGKTSCPSLRALGVCRRWAGNSLRAGTNSCAPGERAGARMLYAVRHACRTHLQPLVVGAGSLVHGLLLPTNGALASGSHLQGTQRRSQDGAARRSMGARSQGSIRVRQGPCVRAHGQGTEARACWRALGGSARRGHDNERPQRARGGSCDRSM
jgi:hypothetical protein